jgi:gliding motility-associated-like protein
VVGGPGTYTAVSTNSAGCTFTNFFTVSTNTTPPTVNVTPSQNTVCVSNSVTLNGTPFGGVYNAACCLSGNVLTPTAAGVYTISYTYTNTVNGCSNQAITTVTANNFAGPSVSVSAVQNPICAGATATLFGSGVSTYTWNTGSNSATINPFYSSPGTYNYTVSGTNGFGCISSAAIQMTVNPGAVFSISGNNITCSTSQPTLIASNSSLNYTWTAPVSGSIVGSPNNSFVVVAAPGTYTASATNSAGCTYSTTYAVSINTTPPAVNLQPSQYTVCTTNSIQLFGSPSGGVYNAPCCLVGAIFTPTASGVFTVSYSYTNSVNGCSNQAAITVTANTFAGPTVNVSALQNPICAGNNATLVGSGVSSYSWSNGSTSPTITPFHGSSGTYNYSVIGTNSLGCKSMASIQLTVNNTPFFTVNNTNIGCTTPNATLTASNGSYTYTWTAPPTGTIISGTNNSVAIVTGTGVYSVTASSGAGCTYSTLVSVSSTTSQAVSISGSSITCLTPTPVLFANPSGLNYTWTTSGGAIIGSVNNQSINVGAPGLYSVYVYNPSTGCYGSAQFTVGTNTITPVVSASAGGSLNCSNTSVALTGTSSITSNVSYQWLGGVCGSSLTLNSTACNPGSYTLQVINLINGCVGSATVQVVSDVNYISATVTPLDILDCNTNTVQVTVNTSTTVHQYNWTGPGIVSGQGSPTITVNTPGVYSVAVTNTVTGCTVGIQTVVIQTTSLFVNLTGTNVICSGNSAVLIASGATSYTWSTGATTNSITVAPSTNTIYAVTGQDGSCTGSTLISVSVLPSPTVTAVSSSATMSPGASVQFTASGAINYTWTPSAGLSNPNVFNPIANPAQTTTYCVEGSNLNGCRDTACVRVQVRECGNLYVPNIFSPNGDGVNDYFCVMGWKCLKIKKFNMTIYNRWGEKVYESDYAGNCWNGIVEGEVVAGNSYVYHIYILEDNGTETVLTGDVTVVK